MYKVSNYLISIEKGVNMFDLNTLEKELLEIFKSSKSKYFCFKDDEEVEQLYNSFKKMNVKYQVKANYKANAKITEKGYIFKILQYKKAFQIRIYGISQLTNVSTFKAEVIFLNKEDFFKEKTITKNKNTIKINNQYAPLKKQLQQKIKIADLQTQDILHYLENCNPSGKEMLKLCSKLKSIRKERRITKQEIEIIDKLKNNANYSYRTDIISETL